VSEDSRFRSTIWQPEIGQDDIEREGSGLARASWPFGLATGVPFLLQNS